MERYAAAGSLAANGAEIVAVADPAGARLNAALRRVMLAARDDPGLWDGIIQPARLLRWRLATRLQADTDQDIVAEIEKQERRLRPAVTDASLLKNLAGAARAAAEAESPLADALLDMIGRTGPEDCRPRRGEQARTGGPRRFRGDSRRPRADRCGAGPGRNVHRLRLRR